MEWAPEQEREEYFEDLDIIIREWTQSYPNHTLIVLGDMNAHVQGYYSDDTNENGKLLLKLWKEHALAIAPFYGPTFERGDSKSAIDYILLNREMYNSITETNILDK